MEVEPLHLRQGERVTDAHVRKLEAAIAAGGKMSGRGVRQRRLPWGTITNYSGGAGGGYVSPVFAPSVARRGENFAVSWKFGLINGVEPKIDDVPISGSDDAPVPEFIVTPAEFGDYGEALVYFRCSLAPGGWAITGITPFAAGATPATRPWTADKLALILFADGSHWRALVTNQGHMAVNRGTDGRAEHLFWGKF